MRPARRARILANLFGLYDAPMSLYLMVVNASGRLSAQERTFVPATEESKVFRTARIWVAIYVATGVWCVLSGSLLPVVLIGGPRFYGTFMHIVFALTQHAGMGENVIDHRLNTRTVHMNRVNRFLYWNMNYHLEHHMFLRSASRPTASLSDVGVGRGMRGVGLDPDDVVPFRFDEVDNAIYRLPQDEFYATDGHCTHERTLLCDGLVMDGIIECPKHNGRFDYRTGQPKGAPAIVGLRTYPVRVENAVVYIDVG